MEITNEQCNKILSYLGRRVGCKSWKCLPTDIKNVYDRSCNSSVLAFSPSCEFSLKDYSTITFIDKSFNDFDPVYGRPVGTFLHEYCFPEYWLEKDIVEGLLAIKNRKSLSVWAGVANHGWRNLLNAGDTIESLAIQVDLLEDKDMSAAQV